MLDVKRWKELKAMSDAQLSEVAKGLGLSWPAPLGCISIMNAEFQRDNPIASKNLDEHFGIEPSINEIIWVCPACGWENTDYYIMTAIPMCEDCQSDVDWLVIMTSSLTRFN